MAQRKDATITHYPQGGYLLTLPDGSEYEADTVPEAMAFARSENVTRVYSAAKPGQFVQLTREDA